MLLATMAVSPAFALGGPVIIGGDDLTDHGFYDAGLDQNQQGWLYIQKALENLKPSVTRTNDNSVAALGSSNTGSGAGEAITRAAAKAGLTVTYYDAGAGIRGFFDALRAGTANPAIVWVSGTGAGNDLCCDPDEWAALSENASEMGNFVNAGGGLMSHGSEYGWLFGLLPNASAPFSGGFEDLVLTADGTSAFPGLTNADVNAGPWHNHFEGDLGGLKTLVQSTVVTDSTGALARVIVGGAAVVLPGSITLDPPDATNPVGTTHTVIADVRNGDGSPAVGVGVKFVVTSGPNAGDAATVVTDAAGKASFSWLGDGGAGTDVVEASYIDSRGNTQSAIATKTWTAEGHTTTPHHHTQCSDHLDNDGDHKVDFVRRGHGDPQCKSARDNDESQ